jgi:hypothetical protein
MDVVVSGRNSPVKGSRLSVVPPGPQSDGDCSNSSSKDRVVIVQM